MTPYKRKWGFTPLPDPLAPRVALRLGAEQTTVRNAFEKQPVTIEADGTATGLRIFGGEALGSSEDAEGGENPEDAASDPLGPGHGSTGS